MARTSIALWPGLLPGVASGIRCKKDGRGSGFVVMLCGSTDVLWLVRR